MVVLSSLNEKIFDFVCALVRQSLAGGGSARRVVFNWPLRQRKMPIEYDA